MTNINIGNKIRELRKRKGITQEALATALSVSPQAVSKWESALTYPDMTLIPVIAGYFEVSLDVLFDYDVTQMKAGVQKIIDDAREYFFVEPLRFAETIKLALQDYPGNEALLMALIDAYEYDMRENGSTEHLDEIIELSQRLITESGDFVRICSAKEFLAIAYLKKNDYEKAKQILETLPVSIELKNDSIALHLKGRDKLNGAILSGCDHLFGLYSACNLEGDAWFRMDEQDVSFRDYTPDDYIPEALKAYRKGVKVLETFLIDEYDGQDQYLWDGMQTFHWGFYCRIAACYKKLGRIDECDKAVDKAYEIISSAWSDFDKNKDYYMQYFYESFREYGLEEDIR